MKTDQRFRDLLGPEGPVAKHHPNYEFRPGQIAMCDAVAQSIQQRHHLCIEAGTGTGKTLSYLLPAVASGKKIIISTGTKNLQEQLFFKDIPFVEKILDRELSVCYVKGRSNYLCLKKLGEIDSEPYLFSPHDPEYLRQIRGWAETTQTGDRSELKELPDDLVLWRRLDARRETCTGQKCPDFEACFVTKVRQRALESDIVVVNHHLFFADLALRQSDFASVLPDYSVVIFDEAHELEDTATQYFGVMVSNYRLEDFVRDVEKALQERGETSVTLRDQLSKLSRFSTEFFTPFLASEGRFLLEEFGSGLDVRRGPRSTEEIGEFYRSLISRFVSLETSLAAHPGQDDVLEALVRRAGELQQDLADILESDSTEHVYWYECRGRGAFLWASPIRVSSILNDRLFSKVDTVILTSATLATGGDFQFIRSRLGVVEAQELILGSHFDFRAQTLLYVPKDIPEPREPGWANEACSQLEGILEASRGRAFVLFTSYAQMAHVFRSLQGRLPYPTLMQGDKSKGALLEEFRRVPNSVLFATNSFWQGVDVQGEDLSCVVIDKLPFSVPSDPVVAARIRHLNATGGNAFYDYQIPEAIILLKQGLGRLIRNRDDRGVFALLDKRVLTKSYGRSFLQSLPEAPLTHDCQDLQDFFDGVES